MNKNFYIFTSGRMKRKNNTFYFISENNEKKSLPIQQIDNIYVFSKIDLNTDFLNLLSQHDIRLHFFNYYGFYTGTYYPRSKKVSGFTVIHQSEHYINQERRLYLARQFLESATFHMIRNLRNYRENDYVRKVIEEIELKRLLFNEVNSIPELMGIEGKIRQLYYSSFNHILPSEFAFDERSKRPPKDPLNALISFGNSLCYTTILSEIYKTYLDPSISFLHEPSTKRFSLSLDLAEIFKPLLVDTVIFALLNRKQINKTDFEYMDEMVLLNENGRKKFIKAWTDKLNTTVKHRKLKRNVSYQYFIRLECYKLIKHCIDDEKYKALKAWW